jgi:hypothetical protein
VLHIIWDYIDTEIRRALTGYHLGLAVCESNLTQILDPSLIELPKNTLSYAMLILFLMGLAVCILFAILILVSEEIWVVGR